MRYAIKIFDRFIEVISHSGFQRYSKNISWLFIDQVVRLCVSLFVGIWIARYMGPENYGLFSYAQSFVALFASIATLGLDSIIVRELVKSPDRKDVILGTSFYLRLTAAIVNVGVVALAVNFTSNDSYTNVIILIFSFSAVFRCFNVISFYFQSKAISKFTVFASLLSLVFLTMLKIVSILSNGSIVIFAIISVIEALLMSCGLVFFYNKNTFTIKTWSFDYQLGKNLLKDSWPLILSGVVLMVQARIDQIMLKEMKGVVDVGYYSVAMRFIEMFAFIPILLNNSLFPALVNAHNSNIILFENRLTNFYRLNFILFLCTGIPIALFSEQIVVIFFGKEFSNSGILLALMSIRLFFANMGVARGSYTIIKNLTRFAIFTMVSGTLVNIVANYYWIPKYGAVGAIWATMLSFFVTTFLIDAFYNRTRRNFLIMIKSILTFYRINLKG